MDRHELMWLGLKKTHLPWIVILSILLIDQVTKILVKTNMTLGQSIPVFGDWFFIHFTENYGMAFGMEFSGAYGKFALSIFRILAVLFIGWYLHRLIIRRAATGLIVCVSLIMAGALGNIIDSAFYGLIFSESHFNQVAVMFPEEGGYGAFLHGKVVDMLYFPIIQGAFPSWVPFLADQPFIFFRPVFNIADSSITIGVFILIIFQKKFFATNKKRLKAYQEQAPNKSTNAGSGVASGDTDTSSQSEDSGDTDTSSQL